MKTLQRSASTVGLVLLLSTLGLVATGLSPASGATSTKAVAGCEKGVTDPTDLSASRQVARCTAGNPAPKPLPSMTTVKMASAFKLEFNSPVLLADSLGEFAKENIKLELVNLSFADAAPQLASGQLDAAIGGIEIALFNAGNNNLPVKAVMGNYYPPDAGDASIPQTGLWCRRDAFSTPDKPKLKEAEKLKWASSVGKGSVAVYYSVEQLRKKVPNFSVKNTEVAQVPSADMVTAMKNKAVDCGVLLDPIWLQVANDPAFFLAATQTPGEPLGIVAFGKNLLQDHPDVGVAFTRAVIRTINTSFNGDYHQNPTVLAEIAKVTNQPTANLTRTPSLVMDWELRKDTATRIQELFIELGVITEFKKPVPESKIVDRSFYLKAVGASAKK
jgi:NitT/TauT family transport system substrate-binding protein